jgi:hypothetical protein
MLTSYAQDSIGGSLKLGLLNTLGKIDVTLDCANENQSDENIPEAEAFKSVISDHVAGSPDASLALKGLSPIPAASLGGGGVYGRGGGCFDAYDASLLDRLHEFQQKPKQEGELAPVGQAQSAGVQTAGPSKKVTTSFHATTISQDDSYPSYIGQFVDILFVFRIRVQGNASCSQARRRAQMQRSRTAECTTRSPRVAPPHPAEHYGAS